MKLNHLKKSIFIIFVGFFLNSCTHILGLGGYQDIDISQDQVRAGHLIGRWLELKIDVFLCQYPDNKAYTLEIPGKSVDVPYSVKEYLQDPTNWQNTDTFAKIGKRKKDQYFKLKIVGIIPKGTRVYVYKIFERGTLYDSTVYALGHIDDPRYWKLPVNLSFLLKKELGKMVIPYPQDDPMACMGQEINVFVNPGIIEYWEPSQDNPQSIMKESNSSLELLQHSHTAW